MEVPKNSLILGIVSSTIMSNPQIFTVQKGKLMIENQEGISGLRRVFLGGIMACIFVVSHFQLAYAGIADKADKNVRIMIEATRKLDYALPENRSYLLVKNETIAAPVGVIFGYVDNAAACEGIAAALSRSLGVGTFKCSPIF